MFVHKILPALYCVCLFFGTKTNNRQYSNTNAIEYSVASSLLCDTMDDTLLHLKVVHWNCEKEKRVAKETKLKKIKKRKYIASHFKS